MEEVVQQMEATAISENEEASTSNFEPLYKYRGRMGNQEERRKNVLQNQKGRRNSKLDKFRGILELVKAVEGDIFHTPRTHWQPIIYVAGFTKVANYCDVLMMSEWLTEKPSDFEENWVVVPCPKGTRMLVLAYKGTTKCFNKYGNFSFECRTALPGGNPCDIKKNQCTVVLDCFYEKDSNTMYVLDILAWNNCVMTEGEASFRHFWMTGQLEQIPELQLITKKNKMIFKVIPKLPCTTKSINELLAIFPYFNNNMPPVDGLLFYHQKAQYVSGETPLVLWLYPFMAPEVLGEDIKVHQGYMLEKPVGYIDYMDYIRKFEKKNSRRKQRKMFVSSKMDAEDIPQAGTSKEGMGSTTDNASGSSRVEEENNGNAEGKDMETDDNAQEATKASKKGKKPKSGRVQAKKGSKGKTEEKTMETDDNAQGDNAAPVAGINGNENASSDQGGDMDPEPKISETEMEAETDGGNLEATIDDILKDET